MSAAASRLAVGIAASAGVHVALLVLAHALATGTPQSAARLTQASGRSAESAPLELLRVDVLSSFGEVAPEPAGTRQTQAKRAPAVAPPRVKVDPPSRRNTTRVDDDAAASEGTAAAGVDPVTPAAAASDALASDAVAPAAAQPGAPGLAARSAGGAEISATAESARSTTAGGTADGTGTGRASGATGGTGHAADLSALHSRLSEAARRCYPASARRFRLTGTVPVEFCVDAIGQLSRVRRTGTSGAGALDAAAVDCVIPSAAPLPAPAGCYTVPVVFR